MELHRASAELRKGRSQFIAISEERNASEDVQTQPGARPGESKMKHTRSTVSTEVQYVSMLKDLSSADSQATPLPTTAANTGGKELLYYPWPDRRIKQEH